MTLKVKRYKFKDYKKAETDTTKKGFKFVYYISAGQTSLLQVQWEITLGRVLYVVIAVFCVIPEIRKGNEIDSVEWNKEGWFGQPKYSTQI